MNRFWKVMLILVSVTYLILLLFFSFAFYEYQHLLIKDEVKKSDIIVIVGTDHADQLYKTAEELQNKGYGNKIIISPFVVNDKANSVKLMKKYHLAKSEVVPDYYSTSMKMSAQFVTDYLNEHHQQSVLFVANDYEMKRLIKTFEKNDHGHQYAHKSVKNKQSTKAFHQAAEKEVWNLPKLWLNL